MSTIWGNQIKLINISITSLHTSIPQIRVIFVMRSFEIHSQKIEILLLNILTVLRNRSQQRKKASFSSYAREAQYAVNITSPYSALPSLCGSLSIFILEKSFIQSYIIKINSMFSSSSAISFSPKVLFGYEEIVFIHLSLDALFLFIPSSTALPQFPLCFYRTHILLLYPSLLLQYFSCPLIVSFFFACAINIWKCLEMKSYQMFPLEGKIIEYFQIQNGEIYRTCPEPQCAKYLELHLYFLITHF